MLKLSTASTSRNVRKSYVPQQARNNMPKKAEYEIRYSHRVKGYELVHGPFSYPLDTATTLWMWFGYASSFHVCSSSGETFTLRKEQKKRGDGYWYAYKRVHGRVEKKYIGEQ